MWDCTRKLWMIPESDHFKVQSVTVEHFEKVSDLYSNLRTEAQADFYSSDNYVKDKTTNLMMAAPTEKTCKASSGFVCKVSLDASDIMMMT